MQEFVLPYHRSAAEDQVFLGELLSSDWRAEILRLVSAAEGGADDLCLHRDPGGKPTLGPAAPWHFNVSNTQHLTLAAFARRDVGLDVEHLDRQVRAADLARRYFAATEAAWVCQAPSGELVWRFLRLWTAKEALVKLHGCGLRGLSQARIQLPERAHAEIRWGSLGPRSAVLRHLLWPGGFLVCVAAWEEFKLALPEDFPKLNTF